MKHIAKARGRKKAILMFKCFPFLSKQKPAGPSQGGDLAATEFTRDDDQGLSKSVQHAASPKASASRYGTPDKKIVEGEENVGINIIQPQASNGIHTQAQWARVQLSEQSKRSQEKKNNFDSTAVSKQAQWAREQLSAQAKSQQVEKEKFDPNSVSQQARWAREQLNARANQEQAKETTFDTGAVSKQAKWAKEQLRLQNQHDVPHDFSDYDVSGQTSSVSAEKTAGNAGEDPEVDQSPSGYVYSRRSVLSLDLLLHVAETEHSQVVVAVEGETSGLQAESTLSDS
eukprot:764730-Hanusia_phi.AAC.1